MGEVPLQGHLRVQGYELLKTLMCSERPDTHTAVTVSCFHARFNNLVFSILPRLTNAPYPNT